MKHKQLLALFLFLVIIASSKIATVNNDVNVKKVTTTQDKFEMKNIFEEDDTQKIEVYYPETKFNNVNEVINKKIEYYIANFKSDNTVKDKKNLFISFEEYDYNDYTSYKFKIKSNTNIIHGNEYFFTIVHKENQIIDIYTLINKNKDILDILQSEAYSNLSNNEDILKYSNKVLLNNGLEKNADNYSNFIFTSDSFVLIFNEDSVAPKVLGTFEIKIPYNKLNITL